MRPVAAGVFDYGPGEPDAAAAEARLDAARRRQAGHFLEVLRQADELYLQGGEGVLAGLALFDLEAENLRAGQAWAAAHAERDDQAAAWSSDYPDEGAYVLSLRLHPREWLAWLQAGLNGARLLGNRAAAGRHLNNLGTAYWALGEPRQAFEFYEQDLAIAREIGDRREEGSALGNLGLAYVDLGQTRRAIEFYEQHLAIAREIGDRRGKAAP